MSFKVEIVADSIGEHSPRLTTMVVTFPRIILAEFNTHRMFSRNSASSRAIPFPKMVQSVKDNPFTPIAWQKDHTGMQGTDYWTEPWEIESLKEDWLKARDRAVDSAMKLYLGGLGATKQLANRLLEPFMWHTVIVTATEWENFFALRCPRYVVNDNNYDVGPYRSKKELIEACGFEPSLQERVKKRTELEWLQNNQGAAEIHMMKIAEMMWDAYNGSEPKLLQPGEWHIPYYDKIYEDGERVLEDLNGTEYFDEYYSRPEMSFVKISTVMAARTSYTVVGEDLKPLSYKRMIEIHDEMKSANPKHMSPFEHCAMIPASKSYPISNLRRWEQYRKMIPGENITR